ncbi:MAG: helicase-exonuclease AddAB subunit AddA [Ruminococcaceae bacterium]|nr:helicase-exonuclease AddAB subunit AddA [Oscillospiraceae bacterium]
MKWTDEQQQVIDARNSNLLVAAAAGSGKTAVLVERLVGRVVPNCEDFKKEDYTDIDRMLVVTFTRDAALELRERVDKVLDKKLSECNSEKIAGILSRQKTLLSKSFISTIDAFCMDVVKQNFIQCGIDSLFAIGSGPELDLLADDILSDILENYYKEKSPAFLRVANTYSDKVNDTSLKATILKVYNFAQNDVNPTAWIENQKEIYSCEEDFDFWSSVWGKGLREYYGDFILSVYEEYLELQKMCTENGITGYQKSIDAETAAFERIVSLIRDGNIEDATAVTSAEIFAKSIGRISGENKSVYSVTVSERRAKVKESFESLYNLLFDGSSPREQMKLLSGDIRCICEIVGEFQKKLLEEKASRRIYSFNDIAHFALDLLVKDCRKEGKGFVPTDIALRYQKQFDEIYIDEYQDTSIIQEILLNSVSGKGCGAKNIFMVGDIKQSIYGFRHACPEFFLEKYNSYEERECDNRLICLYMNFRSRKNVVGGVNAVFSKIMTQKTAEMDYTENEYLNYGATYYDDDEESEKMSSEKCEIVLLGKSLRGDDSEYNKVDSATLEARYIAGRIIEMMSSGYKVLDKSGKMRPVKYSDFAILMRNAATDAPKFAEVFDLYGIPVFAPAKKSFYSNSEIATVLSFLKIIDNPHQDIPLMSVMRSPLFYFTDEDIALIKIKNKYGDLYDSCKFFVKSHYEDTQLQSLKGRIESFFARLNELRGLSEMISVYELIWIIVNENDFYEKLGIHENGDVRQANIRMLLDTADGFESSGNSGLFAFIRNIQRLEDENKAIEEASVCSEAADVVRIKTIHKSKGLEFPVVFLANIDKGFSSKDKYTEKKTKTLLLHRKYGINPLCYEKGSYVAVTYPSVMRNVTEIMQKKELLAEEMRLLYVALTRAREKFIAVGIGDESEIDINAACKMQSNTFGVLNNASYKYWLVMSSCESDCWENLFVTRENAFKYPDEMTEKYGKADLISHGEIGTTDEISTNIRDEVVTVSGDAYVIPVKISVSDIKRIHAAKDDEEGIADLFIKKQGVTLKKIVRGKDSVKKRSFTPSEKGTLAHTCLQLFDFEKCRNISDYDSAEKYVGEFLQEMVSKDVFDNDEADAVEKRILVNFIMSDIGKRIFNAEKVYRETPFTVRMKWCEISGEKGGLDGNEYVSVQGVIDCFIVENDGCIVIDYKTDYLKPENAAAVDEAYKVQIKCYSDAIEKITGKKVKESKIVYLRNL